MMKLLIFALLSLLLTAGVVLAQSNEINIIPRPQSIKPGSGEFKFDRKTKLVATDDAGRKLAGILNDLLQKNYGFKLSTTNKTQKKNAIEFAAATGDTGAYGLTVEPNFIKISGSERGMFYGIQSLMQLIPADFKKDATIPAVAITDQPRFAYRGMHLDVGRHFMPVSFVKKYIDLMSQYKFNYFHWHLTEDQGWRIEIKKYPRLTEVGSIRAQSRKGRYSEKYEGDGTPYGGFYTQDEIRDVVAYAKARYITVIPEIEMPGHSVAALAAYPELGCKENATYAVFTDWGITKDIYCPKEETFKFLEDVLTEVIDLFSDSPYIHIGGDEAPKDAWKASPFVQDLIKSKDLKDEHGVQSYFISRMEKFINSKGKKIIGWDEILEGGLAPNATVMSWRGMKGGIEAAKAHHDVIMTPTDYVYFDYGQGDPAYEPLNIGGYLPLAKAYSFDPVPKDLSSDEAKYIIGGQGNVWTEYIATPEKVEYMAFPRAIALSEVLWSRPEDKNFDDFSRRLAAQLPHLDKQNVNYRIPEPGGLNSMVLADDAPATISLTENLPGAKIYYTIDGSTPDERSTLYEKPVSIDIKNGGMAELKTVVVTAGGRASSVYAATILRRPYLESTDVSKLFERKEKRSGVTYAVSMPNMPNVAVSVGSGEAPFIGLQPLFPGGIPKQPFAAAFDGYINVPADGVYDFQVDSTWDTVLNIDGENLINETGTKDRTTRSAVLPLRAGLHRVHVAYNNRGDVPALRLRWGIKGQGLRNLGGSDLLH
ncbi:MAG TPA: family 20 glycosylhydrolase [Pyrinomonadaceae bacterium]|nr:family 20 glycosylhydrolase [Pyrinomonadaceae bacterium]